MIISKPEQNLISAEIAYKQLHRYDRHRSVTQMMARVEEGQVVYSGNSRISFSDTAMGQLLNRLAVPVQFYNRCSNSLKMAIFNEFKEKYNAENLKLRMDPGKPLSQFEPLEPRNVRAVVSTNYTPFDDHELFPIVFEALQNETVTYRVFQYDDHITQLIVNFPDASVEHNGQTYTAGLTVTNSETAHSSVWIEPVVHTNSCTMVNRHCLKGQGVETRIVHRGLITTDRVRTMVQSCKEIAQVGITQVMEAMTQTMSASHALATAKAIDSLPKRLFDILKEEWEQEEDVMKAEAARRIILLAQELPLFQRISVEQEAGKMLGLFNNYKSRMQLISEEMADLTL